MESNHLHWRTQNHCYHILVHARHRTTCFVLLVGRGFTAKNLQTNMPALPRVSRTKIYSVREQQEWGCSIKRDKPGVRGDQRPDHALKVWHRPTALWTAWAGQVLLTESSDSASQAEGMSWVQGPFRELREKQNEPRPETGLGKRLQNRSRVHQKTGLKTGTPVTQPLRHGLKAPAWA